MFGVSGTELVIVAVIIAIVGLGCAGLVTFGIVAFYMVRKSGSST
jgi:hypothetical protein